MKKRVFGLFLMSLLAFSFFGGFVSAAENGEQLYQNIVSFFETPVIHELGGILFGLWDFSRLDSVMDGAGDNNFAQFTIFIVTWIILLFIIKDLIYVAGSFSEGVTWIVSVGLLIIASQLSMPLVIASWAVGFAAYAGTTIAALEIIVLILLMAGAVLGLNFLGRWSLQRRIVREAMNTRKSASEVGQAISSLRSIQNNLRNNRP